MKKKRFITAAALILSLSIALLVGCSNKKLPSSELFDNELYSNWMSYLKEDTRLIDAVIPGSHDSGAVGVNSFYETQQSTIGEQLKGGVRCFDARVTYDKDTLKYIHGSSDGGGAKGLEFESSLVEMAEFVKQNPKEIIILDFQHTWETAKLDVLKMMEKYITIEKMATRQDFESVDKITIGAMNKANKNFVIIWRTFDLKIAEIAQKPYIFNRDENYYSPYNEKVHKKSGEELIAYYPTYFENAANEDNADKLFILQGVRTGSVWGGLSIMELEKTFRAPMNKFTRSIKDNPEQLKRVNIIMRDFIVDDIKNKEVSVTNINTILSLNINKHLIKDERLEDFKKVVENNGLTRMR